MAKKITRDRLVEPGTFESIQRDGEALIKLAERISDAYAQAAISQKGTLSGGLPKNMTDLTQMDSTIKKTNEYYTALGKIEKHKAQIQATTERARLAEIKLDQDREKAFDRYESKLRKKQADEEKASREYVKQSKILNELKNNYRDIALALGQDSAEAKKLLATLTPLDQKLKSIDKSVGSFHREVGNYRQSLADAKTGLMEIGGALGIAFGVHQVIDFGKESVKAFLEAEKNAISLKNALHGNTLAFETLMEQSKTLQDTSIFSDDDIQKAQKQLAVYGLTADQIEKLTPQILDLASKTGMDLTEATEKSISAINGQTKGLKQAGINFKDTGSKTENFALLTEKLTKFQGASAEALESTIGKAKRLENAFDDIKETIGEYLVNEGAEILDNFEAVFGDKNIVLVRQLNSKLDEEMDKVNLKRLQNAKTSEGARLQAIKDTEKEIQALAASGLKNTDANTKKIVAHQLKNQQNLLEELKKLNEKQVIEDDATAGAKEEKAEDFDKKLRDLQTENIRISYDRKKQEIQNNFDDESKKYEGHTEILKELAKKRAIALEDLWYDHEREMQKIRDNAMKVEKLEAMKADDPAFSPKVKAQQEKQIKDREDAKKKREEEYKHAVETAETLFDIWKEGQDRIAEEKMAYIDRELDQNRSAIDQQLILAAAGKANTLAFEMQKQDELEKARITELERQKKVAKQQEAIELSLAFLKAYENYIGKDMKSGEALVRAFGDVSAAKLLGKALAGTALEGTEDTGDVNGPGLDGKGGSLWMIHPKERVMTAEHNAALNGMSNDEVVRRALMADNFDSSLTLSDVSRSKQLADSLTGELINEVKVLQGIIKSKPENSTNIDNLGNLIKKKFENGINTISTRRNFIN